MRLLALRCGDLLSDAGQLLDGRPSGQTMRIPVMTHAIDTDDGVLMWDTGMHERCLSDMGGYLGAGLATVFQTASGPESLATARMQQAGFAADDVRWVVNSHLHFDHCGCNHRYPAASCVVRRREVEWYRSVAGKPNTGLGAEDLGADDPPLFDYDGSHDLLGDGSLVLLDTKGHTPGHQSLLVTFPDGRRYVLVGDAAYTRAAIESGQPEGHPWDQDLAVAALSYLRALELEGAMLLLAHDPPQWRDVADVADIHAA